jgi:hypothetical protein
MMNFGSKRRFTRIAIAAMIGIAVVAAAGSSVRAADDDDDALLDTKILRGVLKALGLRRDDDKQIDYRERSPLVLPNGKSLPAPETDAPAAKTAGWPDDPDIKRVKQRKEAERNRKSFEPGVDDRPLPPNQLGPAGTGGHKGGEAPGRSAEASAAPSSPMELGAKNVFSSLWQPKEEYSTFAGEPPRTSLIDPPAGYRTPSPNQPYGVGMQKWTPGVTDKNEVVK